MFTIHQYHDSDDTYTEAETGLSDGEVRQALLDRARTDLLHEEDNGLDWRTRAMSHLQDEKPTDGAYRRADEMIYAMSNTQLEGEWVFTVNGKIKVTYHED